MRRRRPSTSRKRCSSSRSRRRSRRTIASYLDLNVKKDAIASFIDNPGGGQVPQLDKREINTSVLVDNGQTVVLGGVYEVNKTDTVQKVPYLGDIPILGNLFKFTQSQQHQGRAPDLRDAAHPQRQPEMKSPAACRAAAACCRRLTNRRATLENEYEICPQDPRVAARQRSPLSSCGGGGGDGNGAFAPPQTGTHHADAGRRLDDAAAQRRRAHAVVAGVAVHERSRHPLDATPTARRCPAMTCQLQRRPILRSSASTSSTTPATTAGRVGDQTGATSRSIPTPVTRCAGCSRRGQAGDRDARPSAASIRSPARTVYASR